MLVRPAEAADLGALLDLWVDAWSHAMPAIDFAARRGWLADHLAALSDQGTLILVRWREATLVGFVTIDPQTGHLDQLVVAREQQKQGHAGALLAAAKAHAPEGLTLSVNSDNTRAIALYERHGFTVTGSGVNARSGLPIVHMAWSSGDAGRRSEVAALPSAC